jgi:hypothetical protein
VTPRSAGKHEVLSTIGLRCAATGPSSSGQFSVYGTASATRGEFTVKRAGVYALGVGRDLWSSWPPLPSTFKVTIW